MNQTLPFPTGLIQTVLDWGRGQSTTSPVDTNRYFSSEQTETLRRALRCEYVQRNPAVAGSWRKGYELAIGSEHIGVTNGYSSGFRIYYRRNGGTK